MKNRYRILSLLCILSILLTGCGLSIGNAGDLNWNIDGQGIPEETEATTPTIPPNPYGPVDFDTEGAYRTCLSGESKVCIDVSEWQGDIDWVQVRDSGVECVMLRIGGRGSGEQGTLYEDERFDSYYEGATAAGLMVGGYFFSQAISLDEIQQEVDYVLQLLEGKSFTMPLVFDWEQINSTDRTGNMDARLLTDCTIAFCEAVKEAGFEPMVYFNPNQSSRLLYLEELTTYKFWLAMYSDMMNYPYKIDMWQYTNQGTVPGITGDVDLNLYLIYD